MMFSVYRLWFFFSILPGAGVSWHPITPQTSIRQIAPSSQTQGCQQSRWLALQQCISLRFWRPSWRGFARAAGNVNQLFFYKERKRERSRGFISGNGLQEPLRKAPPHAGVHQLLSVCNWRFSFVARCRPENMSTIDILTGVYNNYWRQFN